MTLATNVAKAEDFDRTLYLIYPNTATTINENEPPHDKTNKIACVPSQDLDQPGHPHSLISVFAMRSVGS